MATNLLTVTTQVAFFVGSATLAAVMVAVPGFKPRKKPSWVTLTVSGLEELQVTFLLAALEGFTLAVNWPDSPSVTVTDVLSSVTLLTGTGARTVTWHVADPAW